MTGVDFCTTNFRNYRPLKDSSGPGLSQTEPYYVAKFRPRIPFQGPKRACLGKFCNILRPAVPSRVSPSAMGPARARWGRRPHSPRRAHGAHVFAVGRASVWGKMREPHTFLVTVTPGLS